MAFGKFKFLCAAAVIGLSFASFAAGPSEPAKGSRAKFVVLGEFCSPALDVPDILARFWELNNSTCNGLHGITEQMNYLQSLPKDRTPNLLVFIFGAGARAVFDPNATSEEGRPLLSKAEVVKRLWTTYFDRLADPAGTDQKMMDEYVAQIRQMDSYCKQRRCKFVAFLPKSFQSLDYVFADLAHGAPWTGAAITFLIPNFYFDLRGLSQALQKYGIRSVEYDVPRGLGKAIAGGRMLSAEKNDHEYIEFAPEIFGP